MKTILVVGALLVASCNAPPAGGPEKVSAAIASGTSIPLGGHAHLFPFDSAALLVEQLRQVPALADFVSRYGWSGAFSPLALRVTEGYQGILFWFCFTGGKDPSFLLAAEQLRSYDPFNIPQHPAAAGLIAPLTIWKGGHPSLDSTDPGKANSPALLDGGALNSYLQAGDSVLHILTDPQGERFNYYPIAFFSAAHESDYDRFLDRAGTDGFIRYFFGFEEKDRPNRLRVVLLATGTHGEVHRALRMADDPPALQKSWPPPPFN